MPQGQHREMDSLAEVVIVSPGGAPRDKDLYQAQKALSVGEVFAKRRAAPSSSVPKRTRESARDCSAPGWRRQRNPGK